MNRVTRIRDNNVREATAQRITELQQAVNDRDLLLTECALVGTLHPDLIKLIACVLEGKAQRLTREQVRGASKR